MPCDTRNLMGIDLGKIDPGLLFEALKTLNLNPQRTATMITWYGGSYDLNTHQATIRTSRMAGQNADEATAQIKRAYSAETIKATAKKYGWQIKQTAEFKYQVIKSTY